VEPQPRVDGPPPPGGEVRLADVIAGYEAAGFDCQMFVDDEGHIVCGPQRCRPDEVILHSMRRLEGASDPADEASVAAVELPGSGAKGVLVLRYGPEVSAAEGEVYRSLTDHRYAPGHRLPSSGPPDETDSGT